MGNMLTKPNGATEKSALDWNPQRVDEDTAERPGVK
jgi:hypothetical protein